MSCRGTPSSFTTESPAQPHLASPAIAGAIFAGCQPQPACARLPSPSSLPPPPFMHGSFSSPRRGAFHPRWRDDHLASLLPLSPRVPATVRLGTTDSVLMPPPPTPRLSCSHVPCLPGIPLRRRHIAPIHWPQSTAWVLAPVAQELRCGERRGGAEQMDRRRVNY